MFQKDLGSLLDKSARVEALVPALGAAAGLQGERVGGLAGRVGGRGGGEAGACWMPLHALFWDVPEIPLHLHPPPIPSIAATASAPRSLCAGGRPGGAPVQG